MARTARAAAKKLLNFTAPPARKTGFDLQPHPGLRDDAENAFRADEQAIGARPRARSGKAPRLDHALRRDDAQAFDEIVDMGVERREMAARARRDPAAERRIVKALRKMPQGEAVRLQLSFERRAESAGLDPRGARGRVDLEHAGRDAAQIDGDRRPYGFRSRRCSTPPHTLDPPPKGASDAPMLPAQSMMAEISASVRG